MITGRVTGFGLWAMAAAFLIAGALAAPARGQPAAGDTLHDIPAPAGSSSAAPPGQRAGSIEREAPATLVFEGITLTTFRAHMAGFGPAQRAREARRRLEALRPPLGPEMIREESMPGGRVLFVGGTLAFAIVEGDPDVRLARTPEAEAAAARARLAEALTKRAARYAPGRLALGVLLSVLATVAAGFALALLMRAHRKIHLALAAEAGWKQRHLTIRGYDISGPTCEFLAWITRIAAFVVTLAIAYLWLTFVLNRFPQTEPWGRVARDFLLGTAGGIATSILAALPGLVTAAIILVLTRGATRVAGDFFRAVERGVITLPGIHPETVVATRRLVNTLLWLFAVVFIYPLLPGSDSEVFKGLSVFIGLLATLGSAGVVGHMMSGLVLVYSRALKKGDYVRVGDVEGHVVEVGALSTKIANLKDEEFTIPNTVMVGTTVKNFTRRGDKAGVSLSTKVTIGYDAPWRVVHDMLTTAAARTPGIRKEPAPFVLQSELSDFYVEYQLVVRLESPDRRIAVLSQLHQNIQDAFNERGVQIMSPHFEGQPERPVVVPKSKWHVAGGEAGETGDG